MHQICDEKGWTYDQLPGDLSLFRKMLEGPWADSEFLKVPPGERVIATYDDNIIGVVSESTRY